MMVDKGDFRDFKVLMTHITDLQYELACLKIYQSIVKLQLTISEKETTLEEDDEILKDGKLTGS